MRQGSSTRRGLTLIEILVVMAVVAMGWFMLLPRLDVARSGDAFTRTLDAVNVQLDAVREAALRDGLPQTVEVALGEDTLRWRDTEMTLPETVSRMLVNGENPGGLRMVFHIHPCGITDEVRVVLGNGAALKITPLSGHFAVD